MSEISKATLTAILGTIDEGIHAVDANGKTIYYNQFAAQLDGLKREEVIGKHLLEVFPSLDVHTSTLLKAIETKAPIYQQHQRYTNIRGKQVVTVNSTLPLFEEGRCVGAVEIAKDLSRVQELSEKLIDLQAQMAKQRRTKSKTKQSNLLSDKNGAKYTFVDLISQSESMDQLKAYASKAAETSSPILIMGETGTGKELLVQSIHNASARRDAPFIAQNCAALPATLLEGILFGTRKGSFTGAEDRPGLFELADGGTLFLDEINSMPLELQTKLLRVIQESRVRRVGGANEIEVDVRIIAAMNEDPLQAIEQNRLRDDLYYRLNVVSFRIPPLRERPEDIPLLTDHFIKRFNYRFGKLVTGIAPEVDALFRSRDWPGNVRELEHTIEAAMNLVDDDEIGFNDLPPHFQRQRSLSAERQNGFQPFADLTLREAVKRVEVEMIRDALAQTDGNIMQAAKRLGIPRQTLQYKLSKLDLEE